MALMMEQASDVAADVIAGVVDVYQAHGERVQEMALSDLLAGAVAADLSGLAAVVAGEARAVEIIAGDASGLERLSAAAWLLAGRGWDVTVLAPCELLGAAHTALRAAPCRLQPWWFEADTVRFGAHETP